MERSDRSVRDQRRRYNRENPSFSSTLLDAIYRSIDEDGRTEEAKTEQLVFYRETMKKQKQSINRKEEEAGIPNLRRARTVENWTERKVRENVAMRRSSLTEFDQRTQSNSNYLSMHSSSSSSDSSSNGGFSSSESESLYGMQIPKPIRTGVSSIQSGKREFVAFNGYRNNCSQAPKAKHEKHENGFGKTKSKALRILYGELKKAKQPISPGARLASFLNSLFTSHGHAKKTKIPSKPANQQQEYSKSAQTSTCSSASSFSRSCLSKTPLSSRSGAKRSVRFCPDNVIVGGDCRPCVQKNLHESEENLMVAMKASSALQSGHGKCSNEELRFHVMQESRRVEEFARDLLKKYQKKNEKEFDMNFEEDDDEGDDASCTSSDLFELDNLSGIGIERYREELPVYETTRLDTNRAIANGLIV